MICSVNFPVWFMTFGYIATFGKKSHGMYYKENLVIRNYYNKGGS